MNPDEVVIAETERLTLRVFEPSDRAELFEILGSSETMRLMPRGLLDVEAAVADVIDRRRAMQSESGYSIWAVVLQATAQVIGNCGFTGERDGSLELGYLIDRQHWRRGYAIEAANAAIDYARSHLHATSIVATIRPWNDPSIAVAKRLGMHRVGSTSDKHGELIVFRLDL